MRTSKSRTTLCTLLAAGMLAAPAMFAQMSGNMGGMAAADAKKIPSPPAKATVSLDGKAVTINYSAPSMRGRKIMGDLVPYGQVWRTGANAATTLTTATDLMIGDLKVPAGKYTIYTLPAAGAWKLIINKQTGQWGTEYNQKQDLGRVDMQSSPLASAQELMSISFEKTSGAKTELHVKWEKTDESVPVVAK